MLENFCISDSPTKRMIDEENASDNSSRAFMFRINDFITKISTITPFFYSSFTTDIFTKLSLFLERRKCLGAGPQSK